MFPGKGATGGRRGLLEKHEAHAGEDLGRMP
eukprot:CAMPEP_0196571758 /NCGR_PEP_ID=MMETSP1081-20130531/1889_1 /TAXON_ID=36882 /ORGANISM="Pyramimonas amylifera, Strain CCMP720" /LENGTH=30 /DNA_ID= /DNA_START= /DNA_END= /DNA_ORIENTATION=